MPERGDHRVSESSCHQASQQSQTAWSELSRFSLAGQFSPETCPPDACDFPSHDDRGGGTLAARAGVTVTVVMVLWNKLDKRSDDMKDGLDRLDDRQPEDNKSLNERLDRLLGSRLPVPRQPERQGQRPPCPAMPTTLLSLCRGVVECQPNGCQPKGGGLSHLGDREGPDQGLCGLR